jgi:hypothetical protein
MLAQSSNNVLRCANRKIAHSRERDFEYLCSRRQIDWRRLKPKLQRFFRILDRLFLCVPGGCATRELWEICRPTLCFSVVFHNQAQFHKSIIQQIESLPPQL